MKSFCYDFSFSTAYVKNIVMYYKNLKIENYSIYKVYVYFGKTLLAICEPSSVLILQDVIKVRDFSNDTNQVTIESPLAFIDCVVTNYGV
jgi:hypothetical protein